MKRLPSPPPCRAWRLPYSVAAHLTTPDEAAALLQVPLEAVRWAAIGVRVTDADGDPICDFAAETLCDCASCREGVLCWAATDELLATAYQVVVRSGARPLVPVVWAEPNGADAVAELVAA